MLKLNITIRQIKQKKILTLHGIPCKLTEP